MEHRSLNRCIVKSSASNIRTLFGSVSNRFSVHRFIRRLAADETIKLRCGLVPSIVDFGPVAEAQRRIVDAFRKQHPNIEPVTTSGLMVNQSTGSDMLPLMQIAGGIAPDVMYVNFRQSQTYITLKLLYPLDHYVENVAGAQLPDGAILSNDDYLAALAKSPRWSTIERRVPLQCWAVMRRECPYGDACPYRAQDGLPPAAHHRHIWAFPVAPLVIGMKYDRAMFAEHERDGVEMHAPRDWNELLDWAKILTDPEANEFGLKIQLELPSWQFMTFLYSARRQSGRAGFGWPVAMRDRKRRSRTGRVFLRSIEARKDHTSRQNISRRYDRHRSPRNRSGAICDGIRLSGSAIPRWG